MRDFEEVFVRARGPYVAVRKVLSAILTTSIPMVADRPSARTVQGDGSEYSFIYNAARHFQKWPRAQAIRPAPLKYQL